MRKEDIKRLLQDQSVDVHYFDCLSSSNSYAVCHAESLADKALIIAKVQTAGRGTRGRAFFSATEEGLYFSLFLRRNFSIEDAPLITPAAAVAVCRSIEQVTGILCQIKWVNDIVIENRKVCGILTESKIALSQHEICQLVVGIGVNIKMQALPECITKIATALDQYSISPVDRGKLCAVIVNEFLSILNAISERTFLREYRSRSSVLKQEVEFLQHGKLVTGVAIDINDEGNLIVDVAGMSCVLRAGDVSLKFSGK